MAAGEPRIPKYRDKSAGSAGYSTARTRRSPRCVPSGKPRLIAVRSGRHQHRQRRRTGRQLRPGPLATLPAQIDHGEALGITRKVAVPAPIHHQRGDRPVRAHIDDHHRGFPVVPGKHDRSSPISQPVQPGQLQPSTLRRSAVAANVSLVEHHFVSCLYGVVRCVCHVPPGWPDAVSPSGSDD
jgi:hypothetical protein